MRWSWKSVPKRCQSCNRIADDLCKKCPFCGGRLDR